MSEATDMIRAAMDEFGDEVTGLQVRHRERVLLLRPARPGDPRGKWAAMAMLEYDDGETDITIGYGETARQAMDDAAEQANELAEDEEERIEDEEGEEA